VPRGDGIELSARYGIGPKAPAILSNSLHSPQSTSEGPPLESPLSHSGWRHENHGGCYCKKKRKNSSEFSEALGKVQNSQPVYLWRGGGLGRLEWALISQQSR